MSLTVYSAEDIPQGSPEWLQARAGIVTASVVGKLITARTIKPASNETSRALVDTLIAERLTGRVEWVPPNRDMERGTLDEPFARDLYSQHHAPVTEVGFMRLDGDGFTLGYSPDGVVGDDGLIEIKSRKPHVQIRTILDDQVPAANMAQLQAGLLVTGRQWIDYVSYAGGLPLYVHRIYPDPRWHTAIVEACRAYEDTANSITTIYQGRTHGVLVAPWIDHYAEEEIRIG